MNLKYRDKPPQEGGLALPGCGTIHISELKQTLASLSNDIKFTGDLNDYLLGSTGKKEYSGDIDVILDEEFWPGTTLEFHSYLSNIFDKDYVKRIGSAVYLKYKIQDFNQMYTESQPRTGYVQVDFNFGNVAWEKVYHFSPGDKSQYKGAHRNLAISAVCSAGHVEKSAETDSYDRPVWSVRWKFGPKGFSKIRRISVKDQTSDKWVRKQQDIILDGPYFDINKVRNVLFPHISKNDSLDSLENIIDSVKQNYSLVEQERIWEQMSAYFWDWRDGRDFLYPPEIDKYFSIKDK